MKKRHRTPSVAKRVRSASKRPYPDRDPEWDQLEERYSQIDGGDMRRLAELLIH